MKKSDYVKLPKEEKIFGYDAELVRKTTAEYCNKEHGQSPAEKPLSEKPFLASVHEGGAKLAKEHEEILIMI